MSDAVHARAIRGVTALDGWATAEERDSLVTEDPSRFFVPPCVGVRGWLGVYLDVDRTDWAEIDKIVRNAYHLIAPQKLAALLD